MKYRIKKDIGIYYDIWLNRYLPKPRYRVQYRLFYFWWIDWACFFEEKVAVSLLESLKASYP